MITDPVILEPFTLDITPVSSSVTFTLGGTTARGGVGVFGEGYQLRATYTPPFAIAQVGLSNLFTGSSSSSASSANFGYVGA